MAEQPEAFPYATHLNILFPHLAKIDVPALAATVADRWYNQTLCQVNGSVVRLGVMQGEYHWHKHDADEEFFFCLDGEFLVDLEDKTFALGPGQGLVVPKGVVHRTPRAGEVHHSDGGECGDHSDGGLSVRLPLACARGARCFRRSTGPARPLCGPQLTVENAGIIPTGD